MTIECYFHWCKFHEYNNDPEEGPFCYEDSCKASKEEIEDFKDKRQAELKNYES